MLEDSTRYFITAPNSNCDLVTNSATSMIPPVILGQESLIPWSAFRSVVSSRSTTEQMNADYTIELERTYPDHLSLLNWMLPPPDYQPGRHQLPVQAMPIRPKPIRPLRPFENTQASEPLTFMQDGEYVTRYVAPYGIYGSEELPIHLPNISPSLNIEMLEWQERFVGRAKPARPNNQLPKARVGMSTPPAFRHNVINKRVAELSTGWLPSGHVRQCSKFSRSFHDRMTAARGGRDRRRFDDPSQIISSQPFSTEMDQALDLRVSAKRAGCSYASDVPTLDSEQMRPPMPPPTPRPLPPQPLPSPTPINQTFFVDPLTSWTILESLRDDPRNVFARLPPPPPPAPEQ